MNDVGPIPKSIDAGQPLLVQLNQISKVFLTDEVETHALLDNGLWFRRRCGGWRGER